jgi:hypothetical protein
MGGARGGEQGRSMKIERRKQYHQVERREGATRAVVLTMIDPIRTKRERDRAPKGFDRSGGSRQRTGRASS